MKRHKEEEGLFSGGQTSRHKTDIFGNGHLKDKEAFDVILQAFTVLLLTFGYRL